MSVLSGAADKYHMQVRFALSCARCYSRRSTGGPCPEWSEFVSFTHGYARFTALNASALAFEYVNTTDGSIVDRVLILQDLAGW